MSNSVSLSKPLTVTGWVLRIVVAVILLQTLFFKFTGAPESIYIFTTIGQEPVGRIGSGVVELIASVLILLPLAPAVAIGALLALGTMSGAIFFHLTKLGIVVMNDGGTLFTLAIVTWVCSAAVVFMYRRALPVLGTRLP